MAGSAVLGVAAGLIWAVVAPRALLQEIAHSEAELVNVETSAYIVADAWFALITAVGGLLTGVLGYRFLVRGQARAGAAATAGATATAGLVLGALAGALVALWVGENIGLGTYNHLLASSPTGTFFRSSLALGAKSTLAFWPLVTSGVILLAETGARRSGEAGAGAKSRHRKTAAGPADPDASGMWTGEAPDGHAP